MTPFVAHTGIAATIRRDDIDTDLIIPRQFLTVRDRSSLGDALFHGLRYDHAGAPVNGFPLNRTGNGKPSVLVAGANFGCGSSREHAAWALAAYGIRCVMASSFGDIFAVNCVKNGLLPAQVPAGNLPLLSEAAEAGQLLTVDLAAQTISTGSEGFVAFSISAFQKRALLEGKDDLDLLQAHAREIAAFEASRLGSSPWLANLGPVDG